MTLRRFAGPAAAFLVGAGLEVSGLESMWLAVAVWAVAAVWLVLAVTTWEPVRMRVGLLLQGSHGPTVALPGPRTDIEKGFLDLIVDAKRAGKEFPQILTRITKETRKIGREFESARHRIRDAGRDLVRVHKIASETAKKIDKYSEFIEGNLNLLRQTSKMLTDSWVGYLEWLTSESKIQRAELLELRPHIKALLESAKGSQKGVGAFRDSARRVRGMRISRDINRATDRLLLNLGAVLAVMKEIERACVKLLSLINKNLPA